MKEKIFIYQLFPRVFTNTNSTNLQNGLLSQNGCGKFNEISLLLLRKLKKQGYTHIWYIGVLAHSSATDYVEYGIPKQFPEITKGIAGSPYAIRDYYDVDPDLSEDVENRMDEFESLIDRTHQAGLKVITDIVPNHLARNYQSVAKLGTIKDFGEEDNDQITFSAQNNFYYLPGKSLRIPIPSEGKISFNYKESPARITGNDCFSEAPTIFDWYDTIKLNYGVDYMNSMSKHFEPIPNTWIKMRDVLFFWAAKEIDGFRCDMVEMVPLEFWQWVIPQVKERYPGFIFIAEIYNPLIYRDFLADNLFDYLYDKVGLYDTLREVSCGNRLSSDITFTLNRVGDIQQHMLNFMENHDEQRLASDFFLKDGHKGKAAMIVTCCVNNNPVMIYNGQELGERGMDQEGFSGVDGRTSIFDYWSVDTLRRWNNNGEWNDKLLSAKEKELQSFYQRLILLCNCEEELSNGLFYDLMPHNYENTEFDSTKLFAFLRGNSNALLLVVVNFDNNSKECTVNIPEHAFLFFKILGSSKGTLTPLLNQEKKTIQFTKKSPIRIRIDEHSGEIYRISFL